MDKNPLEQVHTGMIVIDRAGREIGTVDAVVRGVPNEPLGKAQHKLVGADPELDEPLPADVPPPVDSDDAKVEDTLDEPQLRGGYLRLAGRDVADAHRYIEAQQIDRVDGQMVYLKTQH